MRPAIITEEEFEAMTARVRGGVVGTRGESIGYKAATAQADTAIAPRKRSAGARPVRSMPAIGEACSNQAPSPTFRSKWEANFAARLELEKRAGLIKAYWYEPFSLWLPGKVRYKPDFLVEYMPQPVHPTHVCATPRLEIIEVKGFSKNRRDGMTRLKIAAALFPCFVWRLAYMTQGGGWDGEYV